MLWFLVIIIANSNRFKPFFNVLRPLSFIFYELVISDTTSWIISVQTWAWFISRHKQEYNLVQWRGSECNAQPGGLLLSVTLKECFRGEHKNKVRWNKNVARTNRDTINLQVLPRTFQDGDV